MKKLKYLLFVPAVPLVFMAIIYILKSCGVLWPATISGIVLVFIMVFPPLSLILEAIGFITGILETHKLYTILFALEFVVLVITYIILFLTWH